MRTPVIAGNWKMNTTVTEAVALVKAMRAELSKVSNVEKVLGPPFVSLAPVKELIKDSSIKLGAQDLYFTGKGAYTGEISPVMVADLCELVIIGHSERRQYFNETGKVVNKKVAAALEVGLKPILCVGEKLAENEAGKTEEVVSKQLKSSLADISNLDGLIIAYEPVWAIGTGRAATGEQTNETIAFIRRNISGLYDDKVAQEIRILYGGSVTAANATGFMVQPEIDGALVGGASLKAAEFLNIVIQTSAMG
jgi:triosephosphate isomerase